MVGHLASYLQEEFERRCPAGWRVQREHAFMRAELSRIVGFSPRADLCLQSDDGSRRLWVELEVSRADPAANQVKFAAAHLFEPFASSDFFVSMVSAHVAPGRRNLSAQAVLVLRRLGLRAQRDTASARYCGWRDQAHQSSAAGEDPTGDDRRRKRTHAGPRRQSRCWRQSTARSSWRGTRWRCG